MARVKGCEAVYEVADQWRERCLVRDGSLLWPDIEEPTWTVENLQHLASRLRQSRTGELSDIRDLIPLVLVSSGQIARLIVDLAAFWSLLKCSPDNANAMGLTELADTTRDSGNPLPSLSMIHLSIE